MKSLIAEDSLAARKLLETFLLEVGTCDVTVNGREAIDAFLQAIEAGEPYDLVCLDIMMPEKTGHEVLQEIRAKEEALGLSLIEGTKVIMITAMRDTSNVLNAYKAGCEAYVVKPFKKSTLFLEMEKLGLPVATA